MTEKLWFKKVYRATGLSEESLELDISEGYVIPKSKYIVLSDGDVQTTNSLGGATDIILGFGHNYNIRVIKVNNGREIPYRRVISIVFNLKELRGLIS